jgi:hypothetical protein
MISKERKEEILKFISTLSEVEKDFILKAMNYDNRIIHFYNGADLLFNFKQYNNKGRLTEDAVDDFIASKSRDLDEEYNHLMYQYILKYLNELNKPFDFS